MWSMNHPPSRTRFPGWLFLWVCVLALVGVGCAAVSPDDRPTLAVTEPSQDEPVKVGMVAERAIVAPGGTFRLLVRIRIAAGHYIYSTNAPHGPFTPLALNLRLPDTIEAAGEWVAPPPHVTRSGESIYNDSVVLWRRLRVRLNAPSGVLSIKGDLSCQACSEELCWPPKTIELSATVEVVPNTRK
jgi:DsbC/DsbD-like thiol-disulfide interchange protein